MNQLSNIFTDPFKDIDITGIIDASIAKNEQQIIDYNLQQLDKGIDAKGKSLGRYRNFAYKNRFEPVDLKLTGEYRRKKTISKSKGKKQVEMFSQDIKADMLAKKYGKDIEGLTDQHIRDTGELIKPHMQTLFLLSLVK